jgi:hypothetical protein
MAIGQDRRISASIADLSLGEVLRMMSARSLIDVKGPLPPGGIVSATFSGLTLEKALTKLMRGYNYVLVNQGSDEKLLLLIMGKVVRPNPTERRTFQRAPARPGANQKPDPKTYYIPPTITDREQRTTATRRRSPSSGSHLTRPAVAASPQVDRKSKPGEQPDAIREVEDKNHHQPDGVKAVFESQNGGVRF